MDEAAKGHLAMLLFSALVGGSFALGSMVANDIAPAALNAVRFAIASVVIGAAALATGGIPASALRAPWRYLILGGLFAGYFVLMFEGLKTAAPVSSAAVFTLTPMLSAAFGWLLLRQITTARIALALAIGGIGALWVIFRGDPGAMLALDIGRGEAVFAVGVTLHAIYTPMVRKLNRGEAPVVFTFGMLLAGLLILTAYGWNDIRSTNWAALAPRVWVALFYLSIAASSMTFVLLQYATLHLPSSKVMAYTYLVPSWVALWEVALGHGMPPVRVVLGVLMTVLALWLLLKEE